MKKITIKGTHLRIEDRHYIEDALNNGLSLTAIAKYLDKDPTTISKEIKRNRVACGKTAQPGYITCDNRKDCRLKHVYPKGCGRLCKKCSLKNCYRIYSTYKPKSCSTIMRFPHVYNGCRQKTLCKLGKYRYQAKVAHTIYKDNLFHIFTHITKMKLSVVEELHIIILSIICLLLELLIYLEELSLNLGKRKVARKRNLLSIERIELIKTLTILFKSILKRI